MPVNGNINGLAIMQKGRAVDVDMLEFKLIKARRAIDELLKKKPMLSGMQCGHDTLGNILADLSNVAGSRLMNEPLGEILRSEKLYSLAQELLQDDFGLEADYDKLADFAKRLIRLSGTCSGCHGSGQVCEPPDAAGVGGGRWPCENCEGKGLVVQALREKLEQELKDRFSGPDIPENEIPY